MRCTALKERDMAIVGTDDVLLGRVNEIAPILRRHADDAEAQRRLPRESFDALVDAGLYNMARPKAFGGLELDPMSMFEVIEAVARHDSAAAWNVMIANGGHAFLAWFDDETVGEILSGGPNVVLAGSFSPGPRAREVDSGYVVDGRTSFVSGAHNADWFVLLAQMMDGDTPRVTEQGAPVQRMVFVRADEARIVDNWSTLGMRGTGSHDVAVSNLSVPERRTAVLAPLERFGPAYSGPLYRLTIWLPVSLLAPTALGIARAAIDDLTALGRSKTPSYTPSSLGRRQVAQRQVAEAEATLAAGRTLLHETFRRVWSAATEESPITLEHKMQIQLASTHGVACAARAVELVHAAAGTSAIRDAHRFQRYFRDIHTITQHAFVSASRYESVGALMFGVDSDWGFFPF
jgi:alkylation response protein AidB-like acyl-CoA dehydrogenase